MRGQPPELQPSCTPVGLGGHLEKHLVAAPVLAWAESEAGWVVYEKLFAVGAYWTLSARAYVMPAAGGAVVAGWAKEAAWGA